VKIEHLVAEARKTMLANGNVMPMIYLELTSGIAIMALDILDDSQSIPVQCGMLAKLGLEECREHPGETPVAASFRIEAWITSKPDNEEQRLRPALDPERREVIIVEMWQADGNTCASYNMPVIRDENNRVADIGTIEGPLGKVSWQLASFLQGVKDSAKTDEEVISRMNNAIQKRVSGMPEKEKQRLREFLKREGMPENLI
jgi:hypothetical protein